MKPEPIDLQNIGKVYHNENEAVCNEENYEDETKEENLCCRQEEHASSGRSLLQYS